jgi:3-(3-hydroxy-phenyl)propionate hydroxylase
VYCAREWRSYPTRERDVRLLAESGGVVKDTPRQDMLPRLETGLLATQPSTARGTLFPQPRLLREAGAEAVLMDEQFGRGWRLVFDEEFTPPAAISGITHVALRAAGTRETEGVVAAWMRRHACHAALIRPDHYVYGAAATSQELQSMLAQWSATLEHP